MKIMNKLVAIFTVFATTVSLMAQAPQKMSYQAVVRNSANALVTNQNVGMRISILQGNSSGAIVYMETQTPTSNANGLVSLEIGVGTVVNGNFSAIDWSNGPYFIKTETDPAGGTNYSISGTSQLLSVPYALYAQTSGSALPGPQGPIGLTGAQGAQGEQGPIGLTGPQGPAGNGFTNGTTLNQMMYWNGSSWVTLNPGANGQVLAICGGNLSWVTMAGACLSSQYPSGSVFCASGPTAIVDVTNPATGKTWMDRNLGATQVATSSTDINSYGDLYQWGRRSDGHQCRTSATTTSLSSTDQPNHGDFILAPNAPFDWRSPQNNNLWQGVNGINNPCPTGYRIPTEIELNTERLSWISNNATGAFNSVLKFPLAGNRSLDGTVGGSGINGVYWSSSTGGEPNALNLLIEIDNASIPSPNRRSRGRSIRCIKN